MAEQQPQVTSSSNPASTEYRIEAPPPSYTESSQQKQNQVSPQVNLYPAVPSTAIPQTYGQPSPYVTPNYYMTPPQFGNPTVILQQQGNCPSCHVSNN